MCTEFYCMSYILFIISLSNIIVLGNETISFQLKSRKSHLYLFLSSTEFDSLVLPKELISNTIFVVHLHSKLMIMSSERDFSFNISSNTKLNYIHYPQSYRTTLLQVSLDMHKLFSNTYSTMYRIQIAVQRIPNHIKIILRLISAGSSNMIKRMLPISFNNIVRILNENEIFINQIIEQFRNFFNLLNEIKQLPIKLMKHPSDKTDLIIYNKFNLENGFEKICIIIQQIQKQLKQIVQLIINLDIKTKFHLFVNDNIHHVIPVLYSIEMNAYFLYQFSSIYTDILDRYVLVQTASMGRYVVLSTDEERFETLSNLSKQLSNILQEVDELFIERQNEFETSNIILQEAYEKLFNEF